VNHVAQRIEPLDWRTLPLSGRVLIEASAGTGKTYNIGLIFLRLILESDIPVEKILVVTFTDAAAQELRDRLRARLAEAARWLQAQNADARDELGAWLQNTYPGDAARLALRRVQLARVNLDRAPIATIHAVCQRILRDFPLDSGSAFGAETLFDETELLRECLDDFWRRRYLGGESDPAEEDVLAKGPQDLLWDLRDLLARDARVLALDATAPVRSRVLLDALEFCRDEIARRARARDGATYAMLINGVYERLRISPEFAETLYAQFPAALIDEFQDTDRRQYEIFDRIYRDADGTPRGLLAMIGDPKQAIYAFRGGDIAAYLRAREQADLSFALAVNQRSSTKLVEACNALYAHSGGGFDDVNVRYQSVSAAGRADENAYVGGAPIVIHAFRDGVTNADGKLLQALGKLEELALEDCAARVVELLNDPERTIGDRRVAPGDIAVLLPNNAQVAALRARLIERGVPCVGSGRGSVFDTDIACELELLLHALLNCSDERAVRGALATRLLGWRHAGLLGAQRDAAAFERALDTFARWRELAGSCGILAVLREIVTAHGARLLALPDGERVLTDLRHLGEAVAEQEVGAGFDGAVAWFCAVRREGENVELDAAQARQLRIESDAQRVQLMTLHAAKGLEFGIVFLPLAWRVADRAGSRKPKVLHFHDEAGEACIDLGSADSATNLARHYREDLQERLRLLYVALTRAIHAVHVYWVDRDQARAAREEWAVPAVDRLIRAAQSALRLPDGESSLTAMAQQLGGIAIAGRATELDAHYAERVESDAARHARAPLPELRAFLWLHSFSSLTRKATLDVESAAADEGEVADESAAAAPEMADPRLLALDVWRGRHFGDGAHKLLEDSLDVPIDTETVASRFAKLGLRVRNDEGDAVAVAAQMLERTRTTDLGDGLRLADLPPAARVTEFEFQFPVGASVSRLRGIGARHGFDDVFANLSATTLNGILTGFADLIFEFRGRYHVLDYKTNRLGASLADYRDASLEAAMRAHHYPLQALLYTVALHRYLRQRLDGYSPERHLGDSWYLFLRAVGLGADAGVWRRRWPVALIEEFDAAFTSQEIAA
jgi:exodeoxyribonuclease V beta subunit